VKIWRIAIRSQSIKNVSKTSFQPTSWRRWCTPVISAARGDRRIAGPVQKNKILSEKKITKVKGAGGVAQVASCLASIKPLVLILVLPKREQMKKKNPTDFKQVPTLLDITRHYWSSMPIPKYTSGNTLD
jgi:hypothetical protein